MSGSRVLEWFVTMDITGFFCTVDSSDTYNLLHTSWLEEHCAFKCYVIKQYRRCVNIYLKKKKKKKKRLSVNVAVRGFSISLRQVLSRFIHNQEIIGWVCINTYLQCAPPPPIFVGGVGPASSVEFTSIKWSVHVSNRVWFLLSSFLFDWMAWDGRNNRGIVKWTQ